MLVIKHKRAECIGCNACVEQAPSHFEMADDGLVRLRQLEKTVQHRNGGALDYARAFEDDEIDLQAASDLCPTGIISIHKQGDSGF